MSTTISENANGSKYSIKYFEEYSAYSSPSQNTLNAIQSVVDSLKGKGNSWSDKRFPPRHAVASSHKPNPSLRMSSSNGGGGDIGAYRAELGGEVAPAQKAVATTILGNVTTGFDSQLLLIRTYLNKTTDKTKADMYVKITNILSQIIHPDMVPENMVRLGEAIYEISSANKFYSKLFASMYVDLVKEYPALDATLTEKMQRFNNQSMFDAIAINTDATSYEQSCKNNKNNDILKAETTFLGNISVIMGTHDALGRVLISLIDKIDASKMDAAAKNRNHELVEYVYILFKLLNGMHTDAKVKVLDLFKCKAKECPGLASKLIFKCMEMVEM